MLQAGACPPRGGSGHDEATAVALDASGNVFVAGLTASTDLAAGQAGPPGGDTDVFVAKLDPTAQTLPCVTYFGGSSADEVRGLVKREFMGFVIVK